MATNATPAARRTARKSATNKETTVTTKTTPARTRTVRKAPAAAPAKVADALVAAAAPTILGPNGEMIRKTADYTVDLLEPGKETERDFQKLLDKEPSEVNNDFVAWFERKSGANMSEMSPEKIVQVLIATYVSDFQKDPAQKAKTIAKRLAAAQKRGEAEQKRSAKKTAAAQA